MPVALYQSICNNSLWHLLQIRHVHVHEVEYLFNFILLFTDMLEANSLKAQFIILVSYPAAYILILYHF